MSIIKAVLGPTNTGKTHYAIERMCGYSSGMMGFPLRLLAREVYDRVVAIKGAKQVALLTGEERIVPEGARYYLCTAEAMPRGMDVQFVAIDEIQMAADNQRGHIFTQHLLHARGRAETLFLGSDTMSALIRKLVPEAEIIYRDRLSKLTYSKPVKLSRLPRRSAVVAFSAADVYGLAELVKRSRGGAALVMGALSPRTRNKQVEMYQSGEVDYLIATDAIGMGLNMDISHVFFSNLMKYDGRSVRYLRPAELGQIAGRAGRYKKDGAFSTLGGEDSLDPAVIAQLENHHFEPLSKIEWRNPRLDFHSVGRLIASLEKLPSDRSLRLMRDSVDVRALKHLTDDKTIRDMATTPADLQRLWDVCQVPDFKKLSDQDHFSLLNRIYCDLMGTNGVISHDWIARQVKRLDNIGGDIDTLAARIASIRVWTYVAHRKGWLTDAAHWAHVTRSVEDKLSDALHERLTQRFVDRRTAVLMRSLRQQGELKVDINNDTGVVTVEGHDIGTLKGFTFAIESGASRDDQKTLNAAAQKGLQDEITRRAKIFANVGVKTLTFDFSAGLDKPKLVWEGAVIGTLYDSGALFAPRVKLSPDTMLEGDNAALVLEKAQEWLDARIAEKMENLLKMAAELNGETEAEAGSVPLSGATRGIAYRMLENYGVLNRREVAGELRGLDQDARKGLRRFGIRIGASCLYIPFVLKPHATELRLMMWAMANNQEGITALPTPGMVWVDVAEGIPHQYYELCGFTVTGQKAVRMDMFERLADAVRPLGAGGDWFEVSPETMGLVGLSGDFFAEVMKSIGYTFEVRTIEAKAPPAESEAAPEIAPEIAEEIAAEAAADSTSDSTPDSTPDSINESVNESGNESPAEEKPQEEKSEEEKVERHFFKWEGKRKPRPQGGKPRGKDGKRPAGGAGQGKPQGKHKGPRKDKKGGKPSGPRVHTAAPKKEKTIDPDSPFAALAGLKDSLKKK